MVAEEFLEVRRADAVEHVALTGDRLSIGRSPHNDVVLDGEGKVSRTHAMIERLAGFWCVRDLDSANGTALNGRLFNGQRRLFDGDEIRIGTTQMVVRIAAPSTDFGDTDVPCPAPDLTPRERDVLRAMLRPLAAGDIVAEPAPVVAIARALDVSAAAVQQHLVNLYLKFDVQPGGKRQVRLSEEALRRGAVRLDDLRRDPDVV